MDSFELTPFDSLVSDNQLQMLKAAIPYISIAQQRVLSLYVKYLEFSNTYHLVHAAESQTLGICSIEEPKRNSREMLNTIKHYCSESDQDFIDLIINFISAFQLYTSYQEAPRKAHDQEPRRESYNNSMDTIKNLLSPEQKMMLDTYNNFLSGAKA